MRRSIPLGRIAGIRIGVHWSLLLVFWLILWDLAASYLPAAAPGRSTGEYWLAGAGAALLFYASLLAHELSHSLVSKRRGIEVDGITLWLFGGVSELKGEPPSAGAEALISAAGPLTSVAAALLFGLLGVLLPPGGSPGAVLVWLVTINLVLAAFNLVPALPLDGGRLLHAAVWRLRGDRDAATVVAAAAGEVFAWVLIGLGVVDLLLGSGTGLWLLLMGWFLQGAARAEGAASTLRSALAGVRVADVMTRDPVTVPAAASVAEFVDVYAVRHRFSSFPVVGEAGEPLGLVTLRRASTIPVSARAQTSVQELAYPLDRLVVAAPAEAAAALLERLGDEPGRALVLDGGRLVGLVAPADFAFALRRQRLTKGGSLGRAA